MYKNSFILFTMILSSTQILGNSNQASPSLVESLIPFFIIFVAMYFIMIRPQIKKGKQHSELLSQLKPGDEVVTSSGIIGKVKSIHEKFISLDLGTTHIKILKDHISALSNTK